MSNDYRRIIENYFEACNTGDRDLFFSLFEVDASHYLPKGMFGPLRDVQSLFDQWRRDAEENGAFWVLESVIVSEETPTAAGEWTAVKPAQNIHFRGVEPVEQRGVLQRSVEPAAKTSPSRVAPLRAPVSGL